MAVRDDHRLLAAQAALTGRDLRLLGWLYDHGVLTTEQIAAALFSSLDICQRRLLKLVRLGVLARFRPQRWEGGSYPYHYVLDQLGVDVVAAQRGDELPRRDQARKRRHHLTSRANLPHLLGTNQFFIDLAAHQRTHPGSALLRWWPAVAFHAKGAFYRNGDNPNIMLIKAVPRPDGHGIWAEDGRQVPFLLELDLGTEPLGVLADKVRGYDLLASMTNWRWPVLFWLPSTRRELNLHHTLADLGELRAVVATAAADHTARTGQTPAQRVWWLHRHDGERLPLAQLPYHDADDDLEEEP
ncbi:replication-relaxation family protein [Phytohabitans sp. ZYX-F-186]|uniref:Replication-relaxation family protein n=1 Tax=Phytohabitans maris TaxID=3071409 RepID=A0ABU0ZVZ9_9ACTN|nr:replication-relaxation family protein [Phytohabitans sp. ZYX-F-186]MDQ7911157.1 replication-relaxation family protein [Phytohabitans sp. ZYX-F-186]